MPIINDSEIYLSKDYLDSQNPPFSAYGSKGGAMINDHIMTNTRIARHKFNLFIFHIIISYY